MACCSYNSLRAERDRKAPADPTRRREAAAMVRGLLAEAAAVCGRLGEQVVRRWRGAAASLEQMSEGITDKPTEDPPPSDPPLPLGERG